MDNSISAHTTSTRQDRTITTIEQIDPSRAVGGRALRLTCCLLVVSLFLAAGDVRATPIDQLQCAVPPTVGPSPADKPAVSRERKLFKRTVDANAFGFPTSCGDGTPAVYYVRAGTPQFSDRWVVYLQGGFSCSSIGECTDVWCSSRRSLLTSSYQEDEAFIGGILDPAPQVNSVNPYADWNAVFIKYCSQDVWTGRRDNALLVSPIGDSLQMDFNGHRILRAVMMELQAGGVQPDVPVDLDNNGVADSLPSLNQASELLLVGTSAGGVGVAQQADRVRNNLRAANPDLMVYAVVDSAIAPDPYLFAPTRAESVTLLKYNYRVSAWNASFDQSCLAAEDDHRCTDPAVVIQHMDTPVFIQADLIDPIVKQSIESSYAAYTNASNACGCIDPGTYASWTRDRLELLGLVTSSDGWDAQVFAPLCNLHGSLGQADRFYSTLLPESAVTPAPLRSLSQVLFRWKYGIVDNAFLDRFIFQYADAYSPAPCLPAPASYACPPCP